MKVFLPGKGEISLTQKEYLASGGQAAIYTRGQTAYKIYTDPSQMISLGKIQELSTLSNPNIIKPQDTILDVKNKVIGYSIRYINDTYALCQLFTKAFRDRNNLTSDTMLALIRQFQNLIQHVHSHKILVVDLNEMNFLVNKKFDNIFAIDVDSYQTPSFPATALMDSVRDRHSNSFNENTDWFSFGVVSFQMFCAIHPFKGKHPTIKSWDERMQKNVSVFNKEVSVPSATLPFTVIPEVYRKWYQAVFDGGKRLPPPTDLTQVAQLVQAVKKIISGSNNFDIKELQSVQGEIINVIFSSGLNIILSTKELDIRGSVFKVKPNSVIISTLKTNNIIVANIEKEQLKLFNASKNIDITVNISASDVMKYQDRLYLKSLDKILETELTEMGSNIVPTFKVVGNILENATDFFDGVVVQNLLGSYYISLFPISGTCYQIRVKELDGHKIIDAKFDSGVMIVVGVKAGKYNKFIFKFDKMAPDDKYELRILLDISYSGINFVVLDNGVCVNLTEEENIEMFHSSKGNNSIKVIDDDVISGDMKLFKNGIKLMFGRGNKLCSMTMKNKP